MNEYQNTGENYVFFQCGPCRGYLYVGIFQDIRSSSSHMYCIVVLKNLAKFTGMHLHWSLFSTCNFIFHWKRERCQLSVSLANSFRNTFIMENLLRTGFERRILLKMQTDILIIIKRYHEVDSTFKKQTLRRKVCI